MQRNATRTSSQQQPTEADDILDTLTDLKADLSAALGRLGDTIRQTETLMVDVCLTRREPAEPSR